MGAFPKTVVLPILMLFMLVLPVLSFVPGDVTALTEGDYEYELTGDPAVAAITKYIGAGGAIAIPSTLGGYATAIIRHDAFNNGFGYYVTSVVMPNSVLTLENYVFANCHALVAVYIGSEVTSVGEDVFHNCYNLETIAVHINNPSYSGVNGILYDQAMTTLIKCPAAKSGDVSIPDTVTSLQWGSFDDCRFIENLEIGSGVTEISHYMFESVDDLRTVTFPSGSSIQSIGERAFTECEKLESFDVPSGLRTIAYGAFQNCVSLTAFDLPPGLESVGSGAFAGCSSLPNLTVPASVVEIGSYAYAKCSSLSWIDVDPANEHYRSIDGVLYNKTATVLLQCPGGKVGNLTIPDSVIEVPMLSVAGCNITAVKIGDGVEAIGVMAFFDCTKLEMVEMGNSVEIIGMSAFSGCKNLEAIEIPATTNQIQTYAFGDCYSLRNITFLGSSAQIEVGVDWILHTPSDLRGHAPAGSEFPETGTTYYGLLMGTNIGEVAQEKDMTETYLLLAIALLVIVMVMLVVLMVLKIRRG